jgi:hypothetical protein
VVRVDTNEVADEASMGAGFEDHGSEFTVGRYAIEEFQGKFWREGLWPPDLTPDPLRLPTPPHCEPPLQHSQN